MYAFMTTYSFDSDVVCSQAYPTWDEAFDAMVKMAKEEHEIDEKENGWDTSLTIDEDTGRAVLCNVFADSTDNTEFFVFEIPEIPSIAVDTHYGSLIATKMDDLEYPGIQVTLRNNGEENAIALIEEGDTVDKKSKELHAFIYSSASYEGFTDRISYCGYDAAPFELPLF